jgi:nicotinamidase/pyrazinamidase
MNKKFTAAFDVDAQKGFTPLCPNELPVPDGQNIVNELNAQAQFAQFRLGSKDSHNKNAVWVATQEKPQYSVVGLPNSDIRWVRHCEVGEVGFELIDGLPDPIEYDFFVYKGVENDLHPYGACYHDLAEKKTTGVIEYLKYNLVKTVIVGGLATEYCVATTAMQLRRAGLEVIVNLGACRGLDQVNIDKALVKMKEMGIQLVSTFAQMNDFI